MNRILVVNDYLDTNGIVLTKPRFVPLLNSRRLELSQCAKSQGVTDFLDVELQSPEEREMTMLKQLVELTQVDVSVLQRLEGGVLVMDGVHRLMAAFARDQSLISFSFSIPL